MKIRYMIVTTEKHGQINVDFENAQILFSDPQARFSMEDLKMLKKLEALNDEDNL